MVKGWSLSACLIKLILQMKLQYPLFTACILSFTMAMSMTACDAVSPDSLPAFGEEDTSCKPGVAQILVGDGYLQNICGCTGPDETLTLYPAGQTLQCHVPTSDSYVFFNFLTAHGRHQIIATGNALFAPTPLIDFSVPNAIRVFPVNFPQASTSYFFEDAIGGMQGEIIVP
jgi:hypothetical protein